MSTVLEAHVMLFKEISIFIVIFAKCQQKPRCSSHHRIEFTSPGMSVARKAQAQEMTQFPHWGTARKQDKLAECRHVHADLYLSSEVGAGIWGLWNLGGDNPRATLRATPHFVLLWVCLPGRWHLLHPKVGWIHRHHWRGHPEPQ